MDESIPQLAPELLNLAATELHSQLPDLSLRYWPGREALAPICLSVLQHGNETTGWDVVRQYLRQHAQPRRPMLIVFGNLGAAAAQRRSLATGPDFNRIWRGKAARLTPQLSASVAQLLNAITAENPACCIDLHNNSSRNPPYSPISNTRPETLALAGAFASRALFYKHPRGTFACAASDIAPSVTFECGAIDSHEVDARLRHFLHKLLESDRLPQAPAPDIYRMSASIQIASNHGLCFAHGPGNSDEIRLRPDLDEFNFRTVTAGTRLGHCRSSHAFRMLDADGEEIPNDLLRVVHGNLLAARSFTPAMLTVDVEAVRQDCLGYELRPVAAD